MTSPDDRLASELRAVATALDTTGRPVTAEMAMRPRSGGRRRARPAARPIWTVVAALTVVSVGIAVAGLARSDHDDGEVATERAPQEVTTPETERPGQSSAAEIRFTATGDRPLPDAGVAIVRGDRVVLLDLDGTEVASGPAPAAYDGLTGRPGLVVDRELVGASAPRDAVPAPADCDGVAASGGIRVALCGGRSQVRDRVERVEGDGSRTVLADRLPEAGHWSWAAPSPDGRWVLAQWSGECEVPTTYVLPAGGGEPRPAVPSAEGPVPVSRALGWAPDGRALVHADAGGCGVTAPVPAVHVVDPESGATSVVVEGVLDEHLVATMWVSSATVTELRSAGPG